MDELSLLHVTLSLAAVLASIWGLSKGLLYWRQKSFSNSASSVRRLRLMESLFIDTQNRLVLVKCDQSEYLLLLGAKGEVVLGSPSQSKEVTPDEVHLRPKSFSMSASPSST